MMDNFYYDRKGRKLKDCLEWTKKFEDRDYKRVAEDEVGTYWVSTVWLGMNHNWGVGRPLIFETMVFKRNRKTKKVDYSDLDMDRYATEKEALEGHKKMVKKWSKKKKV